MRLFIRLFGTALTALLLLAESGTSLFAQEIPALCSTDSLIISTGWDRLKDTLEIFASEDPYWEIVAADPPPTSVGSWRPTIENPAPISDGACQWIHPFNGGFWPVGTYTFETEICLTEIANQARLVCTMLVHTYAQVTLNGTLIGESPFNGGGRYDPVRLDVDVTPYMKPGLNKLQVRITTRAGNKERPGFALAGYITAKSEATTTPFSCNACGQVLPRER